MNDMDTQEISTAIMAKGSSKGCALCSERPAGNDQIHRALQNSGLHTEPTSGAPRRMAQIKT